MVGFLLVAGVGVGIAAAGHLVLTAAGARLARRVVAPVPPGAYSSEA